MKRKVAECQTCPMGERQRWTSKGIDYDQWICSLQEKIAFEEYQNMKRGEFPSMCPLLAGPVVLTIKHS